MPDYMPRYWHMLRCIPRHPARIDTATLAEKLAAEGFIVSRRTIERDLEKLAVYFDIEADKRDRPYGWYWSPAVKGLDIPGMSMSQAVTLTLAEAHLAPLLPASMLDQLAPFFHRAREALKNLNEVAASKWPQKVRVIQASQTLLSPCVNDEVQNTVYNALFRDQQLRLTYLKKGADTPRAQVVNPLGLIQRGQLIYLLCTYPGSDMPLTLAMHRIKSAEALATKAVVPQGFNIDAAIQNGLLQFQRSDVTEFEAIFDKRAAAHLTESPLSGDQQMTAIDEHHVRVTARIADTEQLKWWLLGFGIKVEVIKPIALRDRITEIVKGLHQMYCSK